MSRKILNPLKVLSKSWLVANKLTLVNTKRLNFVILYPCQKKLDPASHPQDIPLFTLEWGFFVT